MRTPLILVGLSLAACNASTSAIKSQAMWLCEHGQTEGPEPDVIHDAKLSDYVLEDDLAYLAEMRSEADGGFFTNAVVSALLPAGTAAMEAIAKHTVCEVAEPVLSGDTATVAIKETKPVFENGGLESLAFLGEVVALPTREARIARVEEEIAKTTKTETQTHTMKMVRTAQGWRASYGLREAARTKIEDEIKAIEAKKAGSDKSRAELAKLEILGAKYYKRTDGFLATPVIELRVKNSTAHAISRAYFRGTVRSPGRSVPWVREEFNHSIAGGIEPGETKEWKLSPNMFSKWGSVDAPKDAKLEVEVLEIEGAKGETLFSSREFTDEDEAKLVELRAKLDER